MAGLEERLSKLESILHRLFCCDTNQFTGPQGPQGPQGEDGEDGIQGPPGVDGLITFQNLNWMGEFTPCVIYNQFDAVSYLGSSYFLNCESSATFECETPTDNVCWILLANAGATGPQGPTGLTGVSGNDGSNSGRWKFKTVSIPVTDPGSTYFMTDNINLNTLTRIHVSFDDINSTDYEAWWKALYDFGVDYPGSLFFIQITEVGSNNIIGIYQVEYKAPSFSMTLYPNYISIGLDPMYVSNSVFTPNKNYTVSWSIHGGVNGGIAPKTEGTVTPAFIPGPYPILEYDYNNLNPQPVTTPGTQYFAALPTPLFIGQTLVVRALVGLSLDYTKSAGVISHNGSPIIFVNKALTDNFTIYPQSCMRFTWSGTYWISENIEGSPNLFNDFKLADSFYNIVETVVDVYTSLPTKAYLNATYPDNVNPRGIKVYFPSIPGGPRVFTRISNAGSGDDWASYPYTAVI